MRKQPVRQALGVLALVCVQGVLAGRTGEATNFFLPHLVVHGVMAVVTPVLLALGWPPLGVMVGLVRGSGPGGAAARCAAGPSSKAAWSSTPATS